jgi:hypothetical protein
LAQANRSKKSALRRNPNPEAIATLEAVAGSKIICKGETSGGEYRGDKTVGGIVLKFTACEAAGGNATARAKALEK